MEDTLSKYESQLKKLKASSETKGIVREAKQAAEKGEYTIERRGYDFDKVLASHLALGDEYAKKGDMKRASAQIERSYDIVISNMQLKGLDFKQANKYINSIEKRAERYINKAIKSKDPKNYEYGDRLLNIAKECKEVLKTRKPGKLSIDLYEKNKK